MDNSFSIDLEKFDYLTSFEDTIEDHLEYNLTSITPQTKKERMFYLLTILTILYKEYVYNNYFKQITTKIVKHKFENEKLLNIVKKLNSLIKQKNIPKSYEYIKNNEVEIMEYVERYFSRKQINYILAKKPMELLNGNYKKLLNINPYTINQCLKQELRPLNEEEKVISDIIDYSLLTSQLTQSNDERFILNITKKIMIYNYSEKKLRKAIMFIIGIVYQETMLNPQDPNFKLIKEIMEDNNTYTNEQLLQTFMINNDFSAAILSSFLNYTTHIKEGRLEELKHQPSYLYVKKRKQK